MRKGSKHSKETRKKMSKKKKGRTLEDLGHKFDCECCICKAKRGEHWGENYCKKAKKIKKICICCKQEFEVTKSKKNQKYCSQKCNYKDRKEYLKGENNPCYRGGKIIKKCKFCGKKFEVFPCQTRKFCSKYCFNKYQTKKKKIKCKYCGKIFETIRHRFCSRACSAKWMGEHTRGKDNPRYKRIELECKYCGEIFEVHLSRKNKAKFCSKECRDKYQVGKNSPNWQNGNYICGRKYPPEFNGKLRESIRNRDNYTCQLCGITEEEYIIIRGQVLSIHHINYNIENNNPENLITLCDQCNTRVNFNREYWMEHFREIMEKKYGFSYN